MTQEQLDNSKENVITPESKKHFYEIKAKFKTKGYMPKYFTCLVFWYNRIEAIEIARGRFDEFIKTQTRDFTYTIDKVLEKDYLFFETQKKDNN